MKKPIKTKIEPKLEKVFIRRKFFSTYENLNNLIIFSILSSSSILSVSTEQSELREGFSSDFVAGARTVIKNVEKVG